MTVAHWYFEEGAVLPSHSHHHEQVTNVISGKIDFTVGEDKCVMESGFSVCIPSDITHSGVALEKTYIIDVFHPVREDYK